MLIAPSWPLNPFEDTHDHHSAFILQSGLFPFVCHQRRRSKPPKPAELFHQSNLMKGKQPLHNHGCFPNSKQITPQHFEVRPPHPVPSVTLCFSLSDVVEAHEARRHSWEDVLSGARLQDERATWHPVHHWTLHQLCHRHDTQLQRSCGALDQKRGRSTLPAQLVVSALAYVWICFTLWRVIKRIGNRNRRRLSGLFFRMLQTCNAKKWQQ